MNCDLWWLIADQHFFCCVGHYQAGENKSIDTRTQYPPPSISWVRRVAACPVGHGCWSLSAPPAARALSPHIRPSSLFSLSLSSSSCCGCEIRRGNGRIWGLQPAALPLSGHKRCRLDIIVYFWSHLCVLLKWWSLLLCARLDWGARHASRSLRKCLWPWRDPLLPIIWTRTSISL